MAKNKNPPGGKRKKSPQPKGTRRRTKTLTVEGEPSTSKLRKARANKLQTAGGNISDFFPKDKNNSDSEDIEQINSDLESEQATSLPDEHDPDKSERILWRVKSKAATDPVVPSQGTPFHTVKVQAEVHQAISMRASLQGKDLNKSMGNVSEYFTDTPRNKDEKCTPIASRGQRKTRTSETQSPCLQTGTCTSAMTESESDDTDASAVFHSSNQRQSEPVAKKECRIKQRPAEEVGSPASPTSMYPGDEDETQPLSPQHMIFTGLSGTLDVEEPIMDTNEPEARDGFVIRQPNSTPQPRVALKRKVPEDDNQDDLPVSKRRPIMFDFEPIPEHEKLHGRHSPVTPCRKLVNKKRLRHKYVDPRPHMYAPTGADTKKYTKTIIQHFEDFRKSLHEVQSSQTLCVPWGRPIIAGRHCAGTLDLMTRGQDLITNYRAMDNDEEDWSHVPKLAVKSRALRGQAGPVDLLSRIQGSMDDNNPNKFSRGIQLIPVPAKYDNSQAQASTASPSGSRPPRRGRLPRKVAPQFERISFAFEDDSNDENAFEKIPKLRKYQSTKDLDEDYVPETQDMFGDFSPAHIVSESSERELSEGIQRSKATVDVDDGIITVVEESQPMSPPEGASHKIRTDLNESVLHSVSSRLSSVSRDKQTKIAANIQVNTGRTLSKKTVMDLSDLDGSGSNYDDAFLGDSKRSHDKDPAVGKREAALIERTSKVSNKKVVHKKKQPLHILDQELFDSDTETENAETEVKISDAPQLPTHQEDDVISVANKTDQAMDTGTNDQDNNEIGYKDENSRSVGRPASTTKRLGQRNPRKKLPEPKPKETMDDAATGSTPDEQANIGDADQRKVRNLRGKIDLVTVGTTRGLRRQDLPGNRPHGSRETLIDREPKQQKVEKKIDCPMCFKKFTETEIEAHAFTCEGETENENPIPTIPKIEPATTAEAFPAHKEHPQRRSTRTPSKTIRQLDPDSEQRPGPSRSRVTHVTHSEQESASQSDTAGPDRHNSSQEQSAPRSPVEVFAEDSPGSSPTIPQQAADTLKDPIHAQTSPQEVATSTCPMCNVEVPCDAFMDHVTSCVDRAEAISAAEKEEGPSARDGDVVPSLARRPLRRRPLHLDDI